MCTNSHVIYNKYANKHILISCGRCDECLQQKANMNALRIKNHSQSGTLCLFVTLTYDNKYIPYVYSRDLKDIDPFFCDYDIPVYRDYDIRYFKGRKIRIKETQQIASLSAKECAPKISFAPYIRKKYKIEKDKDCKDVKVNLTSVALWSEVQNFMKRLRINLKRDYNYEEKITYFAVSEYGETTNRAHFHLLIYFPNGCYETLRPAIIKAWPYGDMYREGKRIQEAIDPSHYLAGYVTKSQTLPDVCKAHAMRQKSTHSKYFGLHSKCFSLSEILSRAHRGLITYNRECFVDGKSKLVDLPLPQYVISRFFPKFKGYSAFTSDEVLLILRNPLYLWNRLGNTKLMHMNFDYNGKKYFFNAPTPAGFDLIPPEFTYNFEDWRLFVNHLRSCVEYYIEVTGKTIYDYALDHQQIWRMRIHYINKHLYDGVTDFTDFYENIQEFLDNPSIAPTLDPGKDYVLNPDKRIIDVRKNYYLRNKFIKYRNKRSLNDSILSQIDSQF